MSTRRLTAVLVANRGEIACRIIRAARARGMRAIAVFSEADRQAAHVALADAAVCIGPAPAAQSYLRPDRLVAAALEAGADCVHPGYGFLSERPDFAEACAAAGLVFIGPPPAAIRAMGLKDAAKAVAIGAGVPVVPGAMGEDEDAATLRRAAERIGFPVLIKAVAGGGGRGMRRVDGPEAFDAALDGARREAQSAFGDSRVLIESYVSTPRHIEVQVLADRHGHVVHLFERDCSLQRRHQKVIEEAPAPDLPEAMRRRMGEAAVAVARAVGYVGAGTVEFIADASQGLRPDRFYFMEMNTRLQVEHPVTEAITGLDLVDLQFRIAEGEPLPFVQDELRVTGHAVEARLYAEDPAAGFLPSTGPVLALRLPEGEGLRVDAGIREGDTVSPFYDPMLAKIIATGPTRAVALDRLASALRRTLVAGPRTNLAFLIALVDAPAFRDARIDTGFIDAHLASLTDTLPALETRALAEAAARLLARELPEPGASPWAALDGFELGGPRRQGVPLLVDGRPAEAAVVWPGPAPSLTSDSAAAPEPELFDAAGVVLAIAAGRQWRVERRDPFATDIDEVAGGGSVLAPMHGRVVAMLVAAGDAVTRGQRLAVVEAMKMEHALVAPAAAVVDAVHAAVGDQVAEGARLVTLRREADHG